MKERKSVFAVIVALETITAVLESPRDRLGRIDTAAAQGEAREALRLLAIRYNIAGASDLVDQCAKVGRAAVCEFKRINSMVRS